MNYDPTCEIGWYFRRDSFPYIDPINSESFDELETRDRVTDILLWIRHSLHVFSHPETQFLIHTWKGEYILGIREWWSWY